MGEIVPILASGLPRVSPPEAAGLWLATRLFARLPRRLAVTLGELGPVALSWEGLRARGELRAERVSFGLVWGASFGRLSLDAALAHRLVAAALGGDPDAAPLVGHLGPGARGVVAGVVAGALRALHVPLAVTLLPPADGALEATGAVAVGLRAVAAGGQGALELDVPARWLEAAASLPVDHAALGALEIAVAVEMARTTLAAGVLARLSVGDVVVFDGVDSPSQTRPEAWRVRVVVGDYAAEALLTTEASIVIEESFRRARVSEASPRVTWLKEVPMQKEKDHGGGGGVGEPSGGRAAPHCDGAPSAPDTALLAASPVEVIAELARLTLRGDEVLGLGPGAVLGLGRARGASIALRVGGEVWAEGELVDIDGELGVRVTASLRQNPRDE